MDSLESRVAYAKAILKEIKQGKINTPKELEVRQYFYCKHFSLTEMPTRPFIFKQSKNPSRIMKELLAIKPTRSLSGVQIIAVMLPPFACPGKCTYCPVAFEGKHAPKSYTGYEPSTLRAQRLGFDSYKIVQNRIEQLDVTGHKADKIELIFQGSTFTVLPLKEREKILKKSFDAVIGKIPATFDESKKIAQKSKRRIIGVTFETRPDYCSKKDVENMLYLGATRIELGVQIPDNKVYEKIKRGHTVQDVVDATAALKDSSLKVLYHLMPGLPGSTYKNDLKNFRKIFSSPDFCPDMIKYYPCLVIKGSELYEQYQKGGFSPMEEKKAAKLLAILKEEIPPYVRIMRVNRDIPSNVITAGIKKTNLRQLVEEELKKKGVTCKCIRCREVGINTINKRNFVDDKPKLKTMFYQASKGEEAFISMESKNYLYGFVRLRKPADPFMKQITNRTALIRELHVYGRALEIGAHEKSGAQHKGIGKILMNEAQRIAKEKFDANKINVISGIGVREYYKKNFNYKLEDPFMVKKI